jgi:tetratricopeptide (TPR) repeat protein
MKQASNPYRFKLNRATTLLYKGDAWVFRVPDPEGSYRESIRILDELISEKEDAHSLELRGGAKAGLGDWMQCHGQDARATYEGALRDLEEALSMDGSRSHLLGAIGEVGVNLAGQEVAYGADSRRSCEKALQNFGQAIAKEPSPNFYHGTAMAHLILATQERKEGLDGRASCRKAIDEFDLTLTMDPGRAYSFAQRANAYMVLGEIEAASGGDPTKAYERAVADLKNYLTKRPHTLPEWKNLAVLLRRLGREEEAKAALQEAQKIKDNPQKGNPPPTEPDEEY